MSARTITTQAELDAALADSTDRIDIRSAEGVWLHLSDTGSAHVDARDSAHRAEGREVSARERFDAKVEVSDAGCWLWTGATRPNGYGVFWNAGRLVQPHRYIYEATVGPIGDRNQIDHLCRVRNCVNPEHLESVTQRENLMRGDTITARAARVTHCPSNHPYDEANTAYTRLGHRRCRACKRARSKSRSAVVVREVDEHGRPLATVAVTTTADAQEG